MRKCNCSGQCGSQPLNRREFLGLMGAGAAAALFGTPAWAAFELPTDELQRWERELFAPAQPRVYVSDKHTDARMHLGGIGTGNFEIGADGQFTTWQLFNTLRDGQVPLHFVLKAGSTGKLLQTTGGPDWPRVRRIEMVGDYPIATLRFLDQDLPVQVELTAFSPFAPLDSHFSEMPLAAFVFKLTNPTKQKQVVSLAAIMQNPVGYDALAENKNAENACFGGNVNEVLREGSAGGLFLRAEAAKEPKLNVPVTIYTTANLAGLKAPPADRPANLKLEIMDKQPLPADKLADPAHTVIWLEDAGTDLPESLLQAAAEAVQAGATLVFSGKNQPLLHAYASWTGGKPVSEVTDRPNILFEDFENGYEKWTVQGNAFGKEPARGTLPNQNPVTGFVGRGLVNSYVGGDDSTGKLISQNFTIERPFIRFLIGGGRHGTTQMRLVVDGKTVRAASGKDNEELKAEMWDVGSLQGKMARIEIVDEQQGGWGHVNVDQIEFCDLPGNRAVLQLLDEMLPARFTRVRRLRENSERTSQVEFENAVLKPGAKRSRSFTGPRLFSQSLGKGKVVLAAGAVLEPENAQLSQYRQSAYAFLCGQVEADYTGAEGYQHPKAPGFGALALAALAENISVLPAAGHREEAWKTLNFAGEFTPLKLAYSSPATPPGRTCYGGVAASITVPAGKSVEVPFLLAWHYPNKYSQAQEWMGCHYATQWPDARAVLKDAAANFAAIRARTEAFRRTFYDSTLPYWLLDCVTANAAIARHVGVVFRIANGDTYGWEGSNGCCQPTCTHVWGYEQSLARLFPDLERDMRRIDFTHQQCPDGGINNRTDVPSPPRPTSEHPFADGHASCILKAYREALNRPDDQFLREYWPHVNRAVEYLIARDAKTAGGTPAGILQDDQWNTYDEALHGVTTFISGYYLAALRAGEEWALRMGDKAAAERFRGIFEKGEKKLIEQCWNGEYFQQNLPDYQNRQGEVGPGCMADQLIGQWWAHQLGLGYILPKDMVLSALKSIYKYNWKSDLTGWPHAPRAFAGPKDKGLIICTWPKGGRPGHVMLYSDEVWTGIEYQVAAHMIYEGMVMEGYAIVKGARDRYDGIPRPPISRNPWNEIECGGHYARAMSSWSLLPALSGWEYDGPRQTLQVAPRVTPEHFRGFFTGPEGWGSVSQAREGTTQKNEVQVQAGRLVVSELTVVSPTAPRRVKVECAGKSVPSTYRLGQGKAVINLKRPAVIEAGQRLMVRLT